MVGFYIKTKRRPCYVGERKAMFNSWSQENQGVLGIVEFEDGSVAKVYPGKIRFFRWWRIRGACILTEGTFI